MAPPQPPLSLEDLSIGHLSLEQELDKTQEAYQNGTLANPLGRLTHTRLRELGHEFVDKHMLGDENYRDENYIFFEKGALLAQGGSIPKKPTPPPFPDDYDPTDRPQLSTWEWTTEELSILKREWSGRDGRSSLTKAWGQLSRKMKFLIITCGLGAATQGWNEYVAQDTLFPGILY
jgi:hypothetical protein